jgi:hypothetical protein
LIVGLGTLVGGVNEFKKAAISRFRIEEKFFGKGLVRPKNDTFAKLERFCVFWAKKVAGLFGEEGKKKKPVKEPVNDSFDLKRTNQDVAVNRNEQLASKIIETSKEVFVKQGFCNLLLESQEYPEFVTGVNRLGPAMEGKYNSLCAWAENSGEPLDYATGLVAGFTYKKKFDKALKSMKNPWKVALLNTFHICMKESIKDCLRQSYKQVPQALYKELPQQFTSQLKNNNPLKRLTEFIEFFLGSRIEYQEAKKD